ncbi:MAG: UbiD family decarboxylase [Rhodospirillaceae bacterium]|nr:UbiD family decarboxylase [Rhodospirillaceae bacterium]
MDQKSSPATSDRRNFNRHEDLRDLLVRFQEIGELEVIEGADWNLEMAAVGELVTAHNPGRAPALLFDDIPGYPKGFRVLSGAANSYKRLAMVLGLPEPETAISFVQSYRDRMKTDFELIPPEEVKTGPIMENIQRDDEVDILKFPAPFIHEYDGGRYIGTDDIVIMKDPDTGWINAATYRIMVHDEKTAGIWISPGKHGRFIREKYFDKGEPCPVVVCCGQDPLLFLAGHAEIDHELSEFDYAGGHRGFPFDVIPSELHGLPIPSHAEIAFEGEIYPDETRTEGPFGEFMGYYASEASPQPIIKVRRVYHRNDPILTMAIPSRPPANFTFARGAVKSAMIWDEVEKAGLPGVAGIWCHEAGAGRMFNVISITQMYPGHAKQAAHLAANCHAGNYAGRWVVVVDEDIDPSNLFDVVWAMSTRCDPPEDTEFTRNAWSTPLDSMLQGPPYTNNRGIIDACRPWGWKDDFPKVAESSPEWKEKVRAKYPHLFE